MQRFFVKNVFFLILVNLIVKPVWIFGIDRNVQNVLGHEVYGQYGALFSFSLIFQIFLDFGLQSYNSRTVSRSPQVMQSLFPSFIWAKALLSLFYFALIVSVGLLIGYRGHALFLLVLLGFVQVGTSFLLYLRSNIAAMHQFKTDSLLSVGDRLFMIVVCGILLFFPPWKDQFRIEWFIYAQIASYLLTSIVAFRFCQKLSPLNWQKLRLQKVLVIWKQSIPFALLIFLMAVYTRSDVLILERILPDGQAEAGVYVAAYRLLDVANNVSGLLFASILLPLFGRMLARKEDVFPIVQVSMNLLLPLSIVTLLVAWFYGDPIMKMLYTNATDYDGRVFSFLMMAFPGFCIGYVYSTLLTANGSLRSLIFLSMLAVALNLTLNLTLIPRLGALGTAVSAAATQVLVSAGLLRFTKRLLGGQLPGRWFWNYLFFFAGVFALCSGLRFITLSLWAHLAIVGFFAVVLMVACRFLPIGRLRELAASFRK